MDFFYRLRYIFICYISTLGCSNNYDSLEMKVNRYVPGVCENKDFRPIRSCDIDIMEGYNASLIKIPLVKGQNLQQILSAILSNYLWEENSNLEIPLSNATKYSPRLKSNITSISTFVIPEESGEQNEETLRESKKVPRNSDKSFLDNFHSISSISNIYPESTFGNISFEGEEPFSNDSCCTYISKPGKNSPSPEKDNKILTTEESFIEHPKSPTEAFNEPSSNTITSKFFGAISGVKRRISNFFNKEENDNADEEVTYKSENNTYKSEKELENDSKMAIYNINDRIRETNENFMSEEFNMEEKKTGPYQEEIELLKTIFIATGFNHEEKKKIYDRLFNDEEYDLLIAQYYNIGESTYFINPDLICTSRAVKETSKLRKLIDNLQLKLQRERNSFNIKKVEIEELIKEKRSFLLTSDKLRVKESNKSIRDIDAYLKAQEDVYPKVCEEEIETQKKITWLDQQIEKKQTEITNQQADRDILDEAETIISTLKTHMEKLEISRKSLDEVERKLFKLKEYRMSCVCYGNRTESNYKEYIINKETEIVELLTFETEEVVKKYKKVKKRDENKNNELKEVLDGISIKEDANYITLLEALILLNLQFHEYGKTFFLEQGIPVRIGNDLNVMLNYAIEKNKFFITRTPVGELPSINKYIAVINRSSTRPEYEECCFGLFKLPIFCFCDHCVKQKYLCVCPNTITWCKKCEEENIGDNCFRAECTDFFNECCCCRLEGMRPCLEHSPFCYIPGCCCYCPSYQGCNVI